MRASEPYVISRGTLAGRGPAIAATGAPYNACLHSFLAEHQR